MTGNALIIRDVSGGYRSRRVIDRLTLPVIEAGQCVALVGPNAAGKTTLLRLIAGLLPATGLIALGGKNLLDMDAAERARHFAYMPQTMPARTGLSVLECVITALRAGSADPSVRRRSTELALATLDRIGITELASHPIDQLSGGQRQLASLAQAFVRNPSLLLLDEPTSALDLRHQVDVMKAIRQSVRQGTIAITVLHDLAEAAHWADRIIVMRGGALYDAGSASSVITSGMLSDVYGVRASVHVMDNGRIQISVDNT